MALVAIPGITGSDSAQANAAPPSRDTPFKVGQWALPRADNRNSGNQRLPGRIRRPRVLAKAYLGGATPWVMTADLDGDGRTSLLYITSASVYATGPDLSLRWATKGLNPGDIIGVFDLARDGSRQVVVTGGTTVAALSATDGRVLWSHDFGAVVSFDWLKVGKLDPDVSGLQIVVWPYAQPQATAFAFDSGVSKARQMWQTSPAYTNPAYQPEVIIGDAAGAGRNQMIAAGYGQVLAYDGKTGALLDGSSGWNGVVNWIAGPDVDGRNYGQVALVDLDGDGQLEYVEVCDAVTEHIAVLQNDSSGMSLLWDKFVDYPQALRQVRTTVNCFADVDGDGRVELVVGIYNQNNDNRWHVLILDALAGFSGIKRDLPDRYLMGVQDLGGNGKHQLLVSVVTTQTPPATADLEIYELGNLASTPIWTLANAKYVLDPHTPVPTTLSPHSANERNEILRADPLCSFVVGNGTNFEGYTYRGGSVTKTWTRKVDGGVIHRIGNLDGSGTASVVYQNASGVLQVERSDGTVLGQTNLGALVGDPIVADLDGKGRNSVILSGFGSVRVLDLVGKRFRERWRAAGQGQYVYRHGESATAADLTGDGRMSVVFADASGEHSRLRAVDGHGREVWSHVFPDLPPPSFAGPNGIFLWTFGNFSGGRGLDVYVGANQAGYNTEVSRIVSGKDGSLLASRDTGDYYEKKFGPWVGLPAVFDIDGDGLDNVAFLAANVLYTFNGLDMAGAVFTDPNAALPYYNTPMWVDMNRDGRMDLVLAAGFNSLNVITFTKTPVGSTLWRVDVPPSSQFGLQPGVADVDHDGVLEIGVLRADGVFECRNAANGTVKWTYDVGSPGSNTITVDADGDGRPEFVFGTNDGRVVCLRGPGPRQLVWSLDIGYPLGDVIAADVNHDGASELLVTAADGNLYVIG
ncbi:FG-GAP-like repeat-containing protein [Dactylosporangium sp. CA-233914]|uniref:FG-GAP-like repeat-containing protein n=1 Tax=Dactylosporangium sp. CA-233914 TaxID=3239934 RepID=UPI003D911290